MNLKAFLFYVLSSVQLLLQISATIVGMGYLLFSHSVMSDSLRPHGLQEPGFLVLHHLLELAHTHIDFVSDPIQPSRPLSSPSSPAFNLSQHLSQVFSSDSALHIRWPKYWSFKFSISPSNDYSGLISFRIDWFDFLAVQGTLKSLLQHHSSKASILQRSAFFMVQLSHPYMTTEKTIALTIGTFVGKVMFLLFTMLSRLIIAFLPRSKHLLISWLQSLFTIILEDFKNKTNKKGSFHFSLPKCKSFAWVLRNHLIHLWSPRVRGKK